MKVSCPLGCKENHEQIVIDGIAIIGCPKLDRDQLRLLKWIDENQNVKSDLGEE